MTSRKSAFFIALVAFFAVATAVDQAKAVDFFFSSGPFAIGFSERKAPPPPVVVPIAPPAHYHPTASLYVDTTVDDVVVEEPAPEPAVLVAPTPRAVVYGPAYRTAPYLTAVPEPVVVVPPPRPAPRPVVVVPGPSPRPLPGGPHPGPYPVRPNNFRPDPYFGPGPHIPGPNHFGGMTPLGPGPVPAYGPGGPRPR